MLFVNAGIGTRDVVADISTDEFMRMEVYECTLSPMRVVDRWRSSCCQPDDRYHVLGTGRITNNITDSRRLPI